MCSLIDDNSKWWNKELVYSMFNTEEADMICRIPIYPGQQSDRMVWAGSWHGDFSVRSAYHFVEF